MAKGKPISITTYKELLLSEYGTYIITKAQSNAMCDKYDYVHPAFVDKPNIVRIFGEHPKMYDFTNVTEETVPEKYTTAYIESHKDADNGSKPEKKAKKSPAVSNTVKAEEAPSANFEMGNNPVINGLMNGVAETETTSPIVSPIYKNSDGAINLDAITEKTMESLMEKRTVDYSDYIPKKYENFVGYGQWKLINSIVKEHSFMPIYIYGVSGLGKTLEIEQACAESKRPFFRVQITKDTTNEDLIGSFSIVNGNTVWNDGPVLMAYKSGGVLLLDEIDLNPALMILQGVLENKPILVTQTGELVYPKEGFSVFATGNTKGDGSDVRYVGTSVMNDAFMERFVAVVEQKIPSIEVEKKIVRKFCENEAIELQENVAADFFNWIDNSRKNYINGNTEIYISTRRIQYILRLFKMSKDFDYALETALSRYDATDKTAFIKTWEAVKSQDDVSANI